MLLGRALVIWVVLLGIASANGAFREALIIPRVGDLGGRAISTVSLCVLVLLLSWLTIRWIYPRSSREAWTIGGVWLALTLAFEFVAGHYLSETHGADCSKSTTPFVDGSGYSCW